MEQVALVLWMLKEIQLPEVRVGAQEWPKNAEKKCVRGKFYDSFGRIPEHLVEGPPCPPCCTEDFGKPSRSQALNLLSKCCWSPVTKTQPS